MTVFTVHISAESCTVSLLYGISRLLCKIDQRELESAITVRSQETHGHKTVSQRCRVIAAYNEFHGTKYITPHL